MKKKYLEPTSTVMEFETICLAAVSGNGKDFTYGGEDNGTNTPESRSHNGIWDREW